MTPKDLPIAVVGTGTVGSMLAGHFYQAGFENIALVDIPERIAQIKKNGIHISKLTSIDIVPDNLYTDVEQLKNAGISTLFIVTKANQLATICPKLEKIHTPDMKVISFQNGIGTENFISKFVDPKCIARTTVNFAGVKDDKSGEVAMHWFHPPNFLGPFVEQDLDPFKKIANTLSDIGLETRVVARQEMKRQVFYKTILNAALNAMCATAGLTMAEAMRMKHTRHLARQLLREALDVAAHMGYHYGEDVLEQSMSYLDKGGDHYPSMWADLQNKRRTEIDFINGKIVQISMMFTRLEANLNKFFCTMVMTEEIRSGVRSEDEVPSYLGCSVKLCT